MANQLNWGDGLHAVMTVMLWVHLHPLSLCLVGRQDPQLYEMRLEHLREMARLQFDVERMEKETQVDLLRKEAEKYVCHWTRSCSSLSLFSETPPSLCSPFSVPSQTSPGGRDSRRA